jgi:hypothetical protein
LGPSSPGSYLYFNYVYTANSGTLDRIAPDNTDTGNWLFTTSTEVTPPQKDLNGMQFGFTASGNFQIGYWTFMLALDYQTLGAANYRITVTDFTTSTLLFTTPDFTFQQITQGLVAVSVACPFVECAGHEIGVDFAQNDPGSPGNVFYPNSTSFPDNIPCNSYIMTTMANIGDTGPTGPTGAPGFISATGTTFGDYIIWDGSAWVPKSTEVTIGANAGNNSSGSLSVAIGELAATTSQGTNSVAIGQRAATTAQGNGSVAVGTLSGGRQGNNCVAIGNQAGNINDGVFTQGDYSIAIGYQAGVGGCPQNAIVLSAGTTGIPAPNSGFYVNPIRVNTNPSPVYPLYYNYDGGDTFSDRYEITVSTSDRRLKTDISDSQLGLDFINALHPVQFRWKDKKIGYLYDGSGNTPTGSNPGRRLHHGFVAQEVKAALDSVNQDSGMFMELQDGPDSIKGLNALRHEEFISPVVKAIQELTALVKAQQQTIQDLEQRLARANL